jgi:hypothetical protein
MVCWALSSKEEAAFEGTTLRDAGRCETGPRWFSFERPFSAIESCDVNGSMGSIALDARRVAIGHKAPSANVGFPRRRSFCGETTFVVRALEEQGERVAFGRPVRAERSDVASAAAKQRSNAALVAPATFHTPPDLRRRLLLDDPRCPN